MTDIPQAPQNCDRCEGLCTIRRRVVNGVGKPDAKIMVIGQKPGPNEDAEGKPFVGKSGKLLALLCEAAGVPRSSSYIYRTLAVRCLSPGNRKPKRQEVEACRDYLIDEIRAVNPVVIVTLGDTPLQALYSISDGSGYQDALAEWREECDSLSLSYALAVNEWEEAGKPIGQGKKPRKGDFKPPLKPRPTKARQTTLGSVAGHTLIQSDTGIPLIPSYDPAYLMHGHWDQCDLVISHLSKARRIAEGEQEVGELGQYRTIKSLKGLKALRDYLLSDAVEKIAWDTETTGLRWMKDELLCFSFSGRVGEGFVVPILHNRGDSQPEIFPAWNDCLREVIAILRQILESDKPKLFQNGLFDTRMVERSSSSAFVDAATAFGIKVNGELHDTELLAHSIAEALPKNMTSLLAQWTDMPFYETDVKDSKAQMIKLPDETLWAYSAADADGLHRLWEAMRPRAEAENVDWVLDKVTMPMLRVCRDMENRGIPINVEYFERLSKFYSLEIDKAEQALWEAVPKRAPGWKYNYAPTLRQVLFQELKLPVSGRKTDSGRGCQDCDDGVCFAHDQTGKDALRDIKKFTDHPALDAIIRLKDLTKQKSTYLDGGRGGWFKHISPDGRIHPEYKISRVETGRLASANPNVQNLPNYRHIHPKGAVCSEPDCTAFYDETFGINTENAFHDMVEADEGKAILNCLAPGSLVITADLRPVPVEELKRGDEIVAIDEEIQRKWGRRLMRTATVTNTATRVAHCYEVRYGGHIVTASEDHLWLVWRNSGYGWRTTTKLRVGDRLLRAPEVLNAMDSHDAGYLAGFLDGDGSVQKGVLNFYQRPGVVLDEIQRLLTKYGYTPHIRRTSGGALGKRDVVTLALTSAAESIRVIGETRPLRLLQNHSGGRALYEGLEPRTEREVSSWFTVESISDVGEQQVIALETDRHTFAAEGVFHHNCDWAQLEVWVLAYRLARDTGDTTLLDVLESGVDIHLFMARKMFPEIGPELEDKDWKNTYPELRRRAKGAVFGAGYGLTVQGYMLRNDVSEEEAKQVLERYEAIVPGLKIERRLTQRQIEQLGYAENDFGRRRHISTLPILKAMGERNEVDAALREANNFIIQSSGSDLHSIVSASTNRNAALRDLDCLAILSVHDSLTFEASWHDNQQMLETAWMIKNLWAELAWNTLRPDGKPLHWKVPVECEWGPTWGSPQYKITARGDFQELKEATG